MTLRRRSQKPYGVPPELWEGQQWLGRMISRPLAADWNSEKSGILCPETPLASEAESFLRGQEDMAAVDRAQVYNRQYWFRLISVMQVDYACTIHVMGLRRYNPWVIRYLEKHPPGSPYLNDLDSRFESYLQAEYRESDRPLVLEAVAYDRAFAKAFEGGLGRRLHPSELGGADLAALPLRLAPHVTCLALTYAWSEYRRSVLDDAGLERVVEPPRPENISVVIYREEITLYEKEVSPAACAVLQALQVPGTLPEVFERLPDLPATAMQELESRLTEWFADFVARGWVVSA